MWQPAPTRQQQWLYRHRRAVRVLCLIFLVAALGSAGYNLAGRHVGEAVLSLLICGSPIGMLVLTKTIERIVERDGTGASSRTS